MRASAQDVVDGACDGLSPAAAWQLDRIFQTTRHGAVVGFAAPEMHTIIIGPEAVDPLGQGQDHLAIFVGRAEEGGVSRYCTYDNFDANYCTSHPP